MPRWGAALLAVAAVGACSEGGAPVSDGSYLTYRIGDTRVRLTFEADGGDFRTVGEVLEADGSTEGGAGMPGHGERVDDRMRTASGTPLELASFGPVWVSPDDLEEGGRAYGSPVSQVADGVAVVSASMGMGAAIQGEWRYDTATGFLVSGSRGTAVSGMGQAFRLMETNVPGLRVP